MEILDTIKVKITKNNGEMFEQDFSYEFGDDVYNYYEFDCETGTLVEKEVDETDMPHISQRAFKKKIDDTIKFVYYTIMVIATLYVVFYIYVLIKNKRK